LLLYIGDHQELPMDASFDETFALAPDRVKALEQLIPGTDEHYYYHSLLLEQQGRHDRLGPLLEEWAGRHGETARVAEIRRRRTLLDLDRDPKGACRQIAEDLGLDFGHEREVEGELTRHPVRLPDEETADAEWTREALRRSGAADLSAFSDAGVEALDAKGLSPERRRAFLKRLRLPDVPGLAGLILADLKHKPVHAFGALPIHGRLSAAQLDDLARQDPSLLRNEAFVHARLARLRPGPDADAEDDPAERESHLDRLWEAVQDLDPVFNGLRHHVLYHRLDLDRRRGVYDRKRFQRFIEIPRQAGYAEPKFLEACGADPARRPGIVRMGAAYEPVTGLPAVADDEPLVADYLDRFFREEKDWKAWSAWIRESWLRGRFAETRLLHGIGKPEEAYALLADPARVQALKDRVEILFPPVNRTRHRAADPVTIEADVKNVPALVVRVFEINTLNVFLARGTDVDTSLDLDGLVAAEEQVHEYAEPPARRVRRRFEFKSLARPGVFVVEFIGGGISSRALIRKGRLRFASRPGAAGTVVTVMDEDFAPLPDASLWMGGREYPADRDGEVSLPFSERSGPQNVLLRHGALTTLESVDLRGEVYAFEAGFHVERESLLQGAEARVLIRPSLRIHGSSAPLSLLEDPVLSVRSTDRHGVGSTMEIRGLELREDRETLSTFRVPDDLATIGFSLKARITSVVTGRRIEVADGTDVSVNGIEGTEHTQDLHLARTEDGCLLHVLGKTGEARPHVPVALVMRHRRFTFERRVQLQSDARGRIELGELREIGSIRAELGSGVQREWAPAAPAPRRPAALHLLAGETLRLPYAGDGVARSTLALLRLQGEAVLEDRLGDLRAEDGLLVSRPLVAGDYRLLFKEEGAVVPLRVSPGRRTPGGLASAKRLLEASPGGGAWIRSIKTTKDALKILVGGAGPSARVHVLATRFLPVSSAAEALQGPAPRTPAALNLASSRSAYVSGRDLGDEYRYILDRARIEKRPGNMLARPGLLLNPWAVRGTQTAVKEAAGGGGYAAEGIAAPCAAAPASRSARGTAAAGGAEFSCLDFLGAPAVLRANLVPDASGAVSVPRAELASANQVRVVVVDDAGATSRDAFLPECGLAPRDLRLRVAIDPASHVAERQEASALEAGAALEVADLATTRIEVYDTLGRAYSLLRTLSGLDSLDAFEFLVRWPSLDDETKRAKYSEVACHELHLFLWRKDPAFFGKVVQPYLANKKDKTFLDRFLLEEDLAGWRRPWEFGRLNALERALLGRRIRDERDPVARHLSDLSDLATRDPREDARRFDAALQGKALEAGDALGMDAASKEATASFQQVASSMGRAAAPMDEDAEMDDLSESRREDEAPPAKSKKSAPPGRPAASKDMDRRRQARALFRSLDATQEWAENNYYRVPIAEQDPELIPVNRFWRDFARHDGRSPFLSPHFPEACSNLAETLCALAVLDLPFEAAAPKVVYDGPRMTLKVKEPACVFLRRLGAVEAAGVPVPVLVSQNFLRDDERTREEDGEEVDRYVDGEFRVHTVYACRVVLTNPTSTRHELDLLLQIPAGSLPAKGGFRTRGLHVELEGYATETVEYAFYFPKPGTFEHYPVHVVKREALVAFAPPRPLKVVERPTTLDTGSWEHVSQHAEAAEVLRFLETHNLGRLDVDRLLWRLKDKAFFGKVIDLLGRRHEWHDGVASYSVQHRDLPRLREFLLHRPDYLREGGPLLEGRALAVDPVALRWHEHLEYAPLVNARAHRLGAVRAILNDRLGAQYRRLVELLRYRRELLPADRLAVTYYLLLQDRVDEALAMFEAVRREDVEEKLQHDYLKVCVEFYRERPKAARIVAEKHRDHPVDRWRRLFRNALAQLDEIEGDGAKTADPEDRDQAQGRLADQAPSFELSVEDRTVTVHARNLAKVRVNYYRMDVELLFSRQPFVQQESDRFGFIMPGRSEERDLPARGGPLVFPLPAEFDGANVVVEVVADGRRASKPCTAHRLSVQVVEPYGQVRVSHRDTRKPVAKAYVKAYARGEDGSVRFFKDGYTDLRGRFDYATLSMDDLDRVRRFSILVLSPEHGAVVREAEPPKR
jgi:hypothetical protein